MRHNLILSIALVLLAAGPSVFIACSSAKQSDAGNVEDGLASINEYRSWQRVNPTPVRMHVQVAVACAAAIPPRIPAGPDNPHRDKYITVWVNPQGADAMMGQRSPDFPAGSVIVKEKLASRDSDLPELLTVMIKREQGYNPECGDWEFMAVDGSGKTVQSRGKISSCQGCHEGLPENDYIFRTYLSAEAIDKMR